MTTEMILTPAQVDSLLEGVLRASGSRLGNYTYQKTLDDLRSAIRAIEQAVLQPQDREDAFCVWHNDPETDNSWDTSCRQLFEIYDGTPAENRMKFCCYCGKQIREAIDHARAAKEGS